MKTETSSTCGPAISAGAARRSARLWLLPALLACAFSGTSARAAQQVEIYSLSIRFHSATATQGPATSRLEFTSGSRSTTPNGELALADGNNAFTHSGFILLTEPSLARTNYYPVSLNIPTEDNDRNGMFDILEQQPVFGVETLGTYVDSNQMTHAIRATWNKAGGSHSGTCTVEFPGLNLTFTAPFENIHYSGVYNAAKTGSNLNGPLSVQRNGVPNSTLSGPLNLQILSSSTLGWGIGQWQTQSGAAVTYEGSDLDLITPAEYSAFYVADDGDLTTAVADYQTWLLVLPNIPDANANGTPDLIEDGASPTGARLALAKNGNVLTLTVTGGAGRTYDLETKSTLSTGAAWTKVGSYTFATNSETIPLTFSADGNAFFRLKQ